MKRRNFSAAQRPTKQLALEVSNLLDLSFVEPDADLDWNIVREFVASVVEGLDNFQLGLLTDWTHKIAAARLDWRRRRVAGKLLVL